MSKYSLAAILIVVTTILYGCLTISFQQTELKVENERSINNFLRNEQIDTTYSFVVDSLIYRKAFRGGFSLPRFKVYDNSGKQIFNKVGYTSNFIEKLEEAIDQAETVFEANTLEEELENIRTFDGSSVKSDDFKKDVNYTFVEYWAIWCRPCKDQLVAIGKYIKEHPNLKINHIKLNWDKQESVVLKENEE